MQDTVPGTHILPTRVVGPATTCSVPSRSARLAASGRRGTADRFLHVLGIHGDPVVSQNARIAVANRKARRTAWYGQAYGYARAFSYSPDQERQESGWQKAIQRSRRKDVVSWTLQPEEGVFPLETIRLGAEDASQMILNPVAALMIERATVEWPAQIRHWKYVKQKFERLGRETGSGSSRDRTLSDVLPETSRKTDCIADRTGYLWARTVNMPILRWPRAALTQLAGRTRRHGGQAKAGGREAGPGTAGASVLVRDCAHSKARTVRRHRGTRRRYLPLFRLRTCHRRRQD